MYISEFWCGVLVTIVTEIVVIIGIAINISINDKKSKK